jgi:hypothetical protein
MTSSSEKAASSRPSIEVEKDYAAQGAAAKDDKAYAGDAVFEVTEQTANEELAQYEIPPQETKALLRTLDSRIAPLVMILYLISFLDRGNIGELAHECVLCGTVR